MSVDNLGFSGSYGPLELRADNVAALVAEGLTGQVMLSNDICRTDQLAMFGGCGYGNVLTRFVPMLRDRGVGEEAVNAMLVANPARAFAYDSTAARDRYLAEARRA